MSIAAVHVNPNLPLVLRAGCLGGSAFCWVGLAWVDNKMDGCPLGLGLVVEHGPTEFSCS